MWGCEWKIQKNMYNTKSYLFTYDNNSKNKIWPKELCLIPLVEQ